MILRLLSFLVALAFVGGAPAQTWDPANQPSSTKRATSAYRSTYFPNATGSNRPWHYEDIVSCETAGQILKLSASLEWECGSDSGTGAAITAGTADPTGGSGGDAYLQVNSSNVLQSVWRNASGTWTEYGLASGGGASITAGTTDPSGGSEGDLHIQVDSVSPPSSVTALWRRGSSEWAEFGVSGSGATLSDTAPRSVSTSANAAGTDDEASRRDHHHQVASASTTQAGVSEYATDTEAEGSSSSRTVTPANLDHLRSDSGPEDTGEGTASPGTGSHLARFDHAHELDVDTATRVDLIDGINAKVADISIEQVPSDLAWTDETDAALAAFRTVGSASTLSLDQVVNLPGTSWVLSIASVSSTQSAQDVIVRIAVARDLRDVRVVETVNSVDRYVANWHEIGRNSTYIYAYSTRNLIEGSPAKVQHATATTIETTHFRGMTDAENVEVDASGFDGNLGPTDDTVQEVAQKLDDLNVGSGGDVSLSDNTPENVGGTADAGDGTAAARDDHVHDRDTVPVAEGGTGATTQADARANLEVSYGTADPEDVSTAAASDGAVNAVARSDHRHQAVTASQTQAGMVELATNAETVAGTATNRAVHPDGLDEALDERASDAEPLQSGTIDQAYAGDLDEFSRADHIHPGDGTGALLSDTQALSVAPQSQAGTGTAAARDDHAHFLPTDDTLDWNDSDELGVNYVRATEHLQEHIRYYGAIVDIDSTERSCAGQKYETSPYAKQIHRIDASFGLADAHHYRASVVGMDSGANITHVYGRSDTIRWGGTAGSGEYTWTFDEGISLPAETITLVIFICRVNSDGVSGDTDERVGMVRGPETALSPAESYDDASEDFDWIQSVWLDHVLPSVGQDQHSHDNNDLLGYIRIWYTEDIHHEARVGAETVIDITVNGDEPADDSGHLHDLHIQHDGASPRFLDRLWYRGAAQWFSYQSPQAADATPVNTDTAAVGTSKEFAREDHDHGIVANSGTTTEQTFKGAITTTSTTATAFANIFTVTENHDESAGFAVNSSNRIVVEDAGRYLACAEVPFQQSSTTEANGRITGLVRFASRASGGSAATAEPEIGSSYARGINGAQLQAVARVCSLMDLAEDDEVEVQFQADIQTGTMAIGSGAVFLALQGGIQGEQGPAGTDDQTASEVNADTTNFGGNLSSTDTTVQAALDTLDNLSVGGGGDVTSVGTESNSGLSGGADSGDVDLELDIDNLADIIGLSADDKMGIGDESAGDTRATTVGGLGAYYAFGSTYIDADASDGRLDLTANTATRLCPDPTTGTSGQVCAINSGATGYELTDPAGQGSVYSVLNFVNFVRTAGEVESVSLTNSLEDGYLLAVYVTDNAGTTAGTYGTLVSDDLRDLAAQADTPTAADLDDSIPLRLATIGASSLSANSGNTLYVWYSDDDEIYIGSASATTGRQIRIRAYPMASAVLTSEQQNALREPLVIHSPTLPDFATDLDGTDTNWQLQDHEQITFPATDPAEIEYVLLNIELHNDASVALYLPGSVIEGFADQPDDIFAAAPDDENAPVDAFYFSGRVPQSSWQASMPLMHSANYDFINSRRASGISGLMIYFDKNNDGDIQALRFLPATDVLYEITSAYIFYGRGL